jgi:hypothetical protein
MHLPFAYFFTTKQGEKGSTFSSTLKVSQTYDFLYINPIYCGLVLFSFYRKSSCDSEDDNLDLACAVLVSPTATGACKILFLFRVVHRGHGSANEVIEL